MKISLNQILLAAFITTLIACGGAKTALINQSDINQASESGQLAALYDKVDKMIIEARGSDKEQLISTRNDIAKRLVDQQEQQIANVLNEQKTEFGMVDRQSLQKLLQQAENVKKWDVSRYSSIVPALKAQLDRTEHAITEATNKSDRTAKDVVVQMGWLKQAAVLAGAGSNEEQLYQNRLSKNVEMLNAQGVEAFNKRMFNMSLSAAEKGLAIDPGNLQFESMQSQSEAALFEQNFRGALESGKPESAYQALQEIADKPLMQQVKKKMEKPILLLANYFANNAQVAYRKKDLALAYTEFQRGRDIQRKLDRTNLGFIQEKAYLDLLMAKANAMQNAPGAVYGLLSIIKEFDPAYPTLEKELTSYSQKLQNRATIKLSVSEFKEVLSSNSVVASVGRRVGSKLEKALFDGLGNQLQIVADLSVLPAPTAYSGDYLSVEGEVLQAAIETNTNKGQRSMNVLTAINKTETEEYADWKRRKRGEPPVQFNEEKVMEDVIIQVERIKKLAVAEVAYRIIEPATQKVLVTDNVVKEGKYSGDSVNEFQKGLFHQKYVSADLPSDIKIMDNLATELSDAVGKALITYLAKPEQKYFERFQQANSRGENINAVELLANAVVISFEDNSTKQDWAAQLKQLVLSL
jgi:predicted house-cleaning noncanonical NTP pyrophosphatase (MazG superfamily)